MKGKFINICAYEARQTMKANNIQFYGSRVRVRVRVIFRVKDRVELQGRVKAKVEASI